VENQTSETPTTSYAKPNITDVRVVRDADDVFASAGAYYLKTEGGETLVLTGANFGPLSVPPTYSPGSDGDAAVAVRYENSDGELYEARDCRVTEAHSEITCNTTHGAGKGLTFTAQVNDLVSTSFRQSDELPSYIVPYISKMYKQGDDETILAHGPCVGSTTLDLEGTNFGNGLARIFFRGVQVSSVVYPTNPGEAHSKIQFTTVKGQGSNINVEMEVMGLRTRNAQNFSYDRPEIAREGINVLAGSRGSELTLRISGVNFGDYSVNQTEVWLTPSGGRGSPTRCTITTCAGDVVTLDDGDIRTCGFDDANIVCQTREEEAKIDVIVSGQGLLEPEDYDLADVLERTKPTIVGVSPDTGTTAGDFNITLTGTNFNPSGDKPEVYFGTSLLVDGNASISGFQFSDDASRLECVVKKYSDVEIVCTAPAGQGRVYVQVVVARVLATVNQVSFTYDQPMISYYTPFNGPTVGFANADYGWPTTGGTVITIVGTDFGPSQLKTRVGPGAYLEKDLEETSTWGARVKVYLLESSAVTKPLPGDDRYDHRECQVLTQNHTHIECNLPPGVGRDLEIELMQEIQVGSAVQRTSTADSYYSERYWHPRNGTGKFSYDPPEFVAISPREGPTSGGEEITVEGRNFGTNSLRSLGSSIDFYFKDLDSSPVALKVHRQDSFSFELPTGEGFDIQMWLAIDSTDDTPEGGVYLLPFKFNYASPRVDSIRAGILGVEADNPTRKVDHEWALDANGMELRLYGKNFGKAGGADAKVYIYSGDFDDGNSNTTGRRQLSFRPSHRQLVGAEQAQHECLPLEGSTSVIVSDNSIECQAPQMTVGPKKVIVTIADQPSPEWTGTSGSDNSTSVFRAVCPPGFFAGAVMPGEGTAWECAACPENAICDYNPTVQIQEGCENDEFREEIENTVLCQTDTPYFNEPVANPGFWKLREGGAEDYQYLFVQCSPPEACLGNYACAEGYAGKSCQSCAILFFRDVFNQKCTKCPANPEMLLFFYFIALALIGWFAFKLHKRGPNMAAIFIGIDYFQVLSMYANLNLDWPTYVESSMEYSSLAMGSLEITSPECSIQMSYQTKWYQILLLPVYIAITMVFAHCVLFARKWVRSKLRGQDTTHVKKGFYGHIPMMVSFYLQANYCLYIWITKTALEIFRCDRVGEKLYLHSDPSVPCFGTEYDYMRSVSLAVVICFSLGLPVFMASILFTLRERIRSDQTLYISGKGAHKEDNPHYYYRKKYGKLYQFFKAEHFYWIVLLMVRKLIMSLIIAIIANSLFAASLGVIVLFGFLLIHNKSTPYLEPSVYDMGKFQRKDEEHGDDVKNSATGKVLTPAEKTFRNLELPPELTQRYRVPKFTGKEGQSQKQRMFLMSIKQKMLQQRPMAEDDLKRARYYLQEHRFRYMQSLVLYDYNKMESRFLASGLLVLLSGIMFHAADKAQDICTVGESQDNETKSATIEALGVVVMLVVTTTTVYFFSVFFVELYKYWLLFRSINRWVTGSKCDISEEPSSEEISPYERGLLRAKRWLLPQIYDIKERAAHQIHNLKDGVVHQVDGLLHHHPRGSATVAANRASGRASNRSSNMRDSNRGSNMRDSSNRGSNMRDSMRGMLGRVSVRGMLSNPFGSSETLVGKNTMGHDAAGFPTQMPGLRTLSNAEATTNPMMERIDETWKGGALMPQSISRADTFEADEYPEEGGEGGRRMNIERAQSHDALPFPEEMGSATLGTIAEVSNPMGTAGREGAAVGGAVAPHPRSAILRVHHGVAETVTAVAAGAAGAAGGGEGEGGGGASGADAEGHGRDAFGASRTRGWRSKNSGKPPRDSRLPKVAMEGDMEEDSSGDDTAPRSNSITTHPRSNSKSVI
jgi:hypothetical protein